MPHYYSSYVKGYKQKNIPFTIVSTTEETDRLAVFLPGAGYTAQAPLFHYASSLFLDASMDVLSINYPYHDEFYRDFTWEELEEAISHDVNAVLDYILSEKDYKRCVILAKSIGTLCVESILKRGHIREAKAIWVTPLLEKKQVLNALAQSKHESLCIIGDQDPNYTPEGFKRISENPLVTARLILHMDHGLEHEGHILESIDMLKSIMQDMKDFI
ncbi:alpha/beta hydrolase [Pradoshia sp.]